MKIDMCESLVNSWLKYVKKCELVSTNWKIPVKAASRIEVCEKLLSINTDKEFFRSNTDLSQLLRQAEADVVGYNFEASHLYIVDTAFHEGGLGYKHPAESVAKKLLRSVIVGLAFFETPKQISVIFASPFVRPTTHQRVMDAFEKLKGRIDEVLGKDVNVEVAVLFNVEFNSEILKPTVAAAKTVADTGDLFIRSLKLLALSDKQLPAVLDAVNTKNDNDVEDDPDDRSEEEEVYREYPAPGEHVRNTLGELIQNRKLTKVHLPQLVDAEMSREIFGLRYPLFSEQRDPIRKYYRDPFTIDGKEYYLTNDWYARNMGRFDAWHRDFAPQQRL